MIYGPSVRFHFHMLVLEAQYASYNYFQHGIATHSGLISSLSPQYSGLARDLPPNVHLLPLERLDHTHQLLRLEHQFQSNEQPYNNTVAVQLAVSYIIPHTAFQHRISS